MEGMARNEDVGILLHRQREQMGGRLNRKSSPICATASGRCVYGAPEAAESGGRQVSESKIQTGKEEAHCSVSAFAG